MREINSTVIRQIFILLLILLFGSLIFKEMLPYLSGVLGAITIYVILRKFMIVLVNKKWNPTLAASFLMFLSLIIIVIPVIGVLLLLSTKISKATENFENVLSVIKQQLTHLEQRYRYDLSSEIDMSAISSWLSESLQNFAGGTFNVIVAIGIMYFLLFYMLTNRRQLRESLLEYIPIKNENLKDIGKQSQDIVRANVIGIPLVAVSQGIVALIGFLIFNIDNPLFWFAIVTVGSMIPFIGTFIGILPLFILTLSSGTPFQAWGILLYGVVVVSSTDNILRIYALRKLDDVHPIITLIGVIVGVPLFGFIGLIFGPLLVSSFIIIVKLYKIEFGTPS